MKGVIVILMKGYNGKSRVNLDKECRKKLIDALAIDLYNASVDANIWDNFWDCFIATPDKSLLTTCKKEKIPILNLVPGELNSIFSQIQNWAIKNNYDSIILCAGDLPLLDGELIDTIKNKIIYDVRKKRKSMVVCPSKKNGVSIIAMSPPDLWMIAEQNGVENLHVIKGLNRDKYPYEILDDPRSYLDLDCPEDLKSTLDFMENNPTYMGRLVKKVLTNLFPLISV